MLLNKKYRLKILSYVLIVFAAVSVINSSILECMSDLNSLTVNTHQEAATHSHQHGDHHSNDHSSHKHNSESSVECCTDGSTIIGTNFNNTIQPKVISTLVEGSNNKALISLELNKGIPHTYKNPPSTRFRILVSIFPHAPPSIS